jgi:hypothetical protein
MNFHGWAGRVIGVSSPVRSRRSIGWIEARHAIMSEVMNETNGGQRRFGRMGEMIASVLHDDLAAGEG